MEARGGSLTFILARGLSDTRFASLSTIFFLAERDFFLFLFFFALLEFFSNTRLQKSALLEYFYSLLASVCCLCTLSMLKSEVAETGYKFKRWQQEGRFFLVPSAAHSSAANFNHFGSIPRGWVTNKNGNSYMPNEGKKNVRVMLGFYADLNI